MSRERKHWRPEEDAYLAANYARRTCADLSEWLHRSARAIQTRAFHKGLRKDPEWLAERHKPSQFTKGHKPFNKGRDYDEWMSEAGRRNSAKTQFRAGECRVTSPTYRPAGYECIRTDKPFDKRLIKVLDELSI